MPSIHHIKWIFASCWLAGCSSTLGGASVDASAYASMNCNELNAAVGEVSTGISQAAIERAKVARPGILIWLPGGERVASSAVDRRTAKIEDAEARLRVITAARDRACS